MNMLVDVMAPFHFVDRLFVLDGSGGPLKVILKKHLAFIPLEIRPERLGLPKCRVPSLPPYKMVWGHLQNGSTHGGCCLQNGGTRVPHLPTNIKYFGLT